MYFGELLGSTIAAFLLVWSMNSDALIFGSYMDGDCPDHLGTATYTLMSLIIVKLILSTIASCKLLVRNRNLETYRTLLRRFILHVRFVSARWIYGILFTADFLTVAVLLTCIPVRPVAAEYCGTFYSLFLLILLVYQVVVAFRLPSLLCLFMYGKRWWRWLKRQCDCLNTVEYEQRVDF